MNLLRKISSHFAWTPQGWLRSPILSFDAQGRLVSIECTTEIDRHAGVEFFSGALLPGLVNAHTHTELSYLHGKIPAGTGFAGFADAISSLRNQTPERERAASAAFRDAQLHALGVTAAGDICNSALTFAHKTSSPLHYLNFVEYYGLGRTGFTATDAVAQQAAAAGLRYSKTPHATYSLADAPFRSIAAEGNPLSIHFMESAAEAELFRQTGPLHERNARLGLPVDFLHYGSPAGRIVGSISAEKNVLLVHNTFVDEETVDRIHAHFRTPVSWVLCPRSNARIEGAAPPVALLRRKGAAIALGTDSLASNDDLSPLGEMRALLALGASLDEAVSWATLGGAAALGIDGWAGSFEPGKRPGAVLLSGADIPAGTLPATASIRRIV